MIAPPAQLHCSPNGNLLPRYWASQDMPKHTLLHLLPLGYSPVLVPMVFATVARATLASHSPSGCNLSFARTFCPRISSPMLFCSLGLPLGIYPYFTALNSLTCLWAVVLGCPGFSRPYFARPNRPLPSGYQPYQVLPALTRLLLHGLCCTLPCLPLGSLPIPSELPSSWLSSSLPMFTFGHYTLLALAFPERAQLSLLADSAHQSLVGWNEQTNQYKKRRRTR